MNNYHHDIDRLVESFSNFGDFAVLDREAMKRALAVDESGLEILLTVELLPEATLGDHWSVPHLRAHLGRLAAERDRMSRERARAADSSKLLNEAEVSAALGCDRVELYRRVVAGELPQPFLARGVENVWRYDDVMAAKARSA